MPPPSASLPLAPDRYTGRKLGKYDVLCKLSAGGMSQIFLAFQTGVAGFRKLVVLKQILPDIQAEEDIVQMFLDEARLTASFTHPHIAHVYDLDEAEGELFLAMEFVPGATLIDVARACRDAKEPIPIGLALMAVRDTALALNYAHTFRDPMGRTRQVIHRDVAEKNIMVTYEGVTKLLDFGIAKALGRSTRTAAGKVKGTAGYMSPEQIRGDELDARSDVFSLGVVLHECLTGMRLYYDKDPEAGMLAVFKGKPAPPSESNPEVSRALDAVTMRALAHERADRYASGLELARALERAAGPQLWHPETCAEFMNRHFDTRRSQTAALLESLNFEPRPEPRRAPSRSARGELLTAPPVHRRNTPQSRIPGQNPYDHIATQVTDPGTGVGARGGDDLQTVVRLPDAPSAPGLNSATNLVSAPEGWRSRLVHTGAVVALGTVIAALVLASAAVVLRVLGKI